MNLLSSDTITSAIAIYGGVTLISIWVGMIFWTYRDIRTRSRDGITQTIATGAVTILNIPGLFLYLFLRPKETLSEAYERSLEEEALLQEIEEKETCPGCGQSILDTWQVCPHCHTQLKKLCIRCNQPLELNWRICPYCTSTQPGDQQPTTTDYQITRRTTRQTDTRSSGNIEFINEDE